MKRIYYLSKLKRGKKEKEPKIKIIIPAGTEIYIQKVNNFVPIISRYELKVKVLMEDQTKYIFKPPKSERLAWVEKNKVEII